MASLPSDVENVAGDELRITWQDGHVSAISFRVLRGSCPCAQCSEHGTRRPLIDPTRVSADLRGVRVEPVGNYALGVTFSDGHSTGIYSFDLLRRLCPCGACRGKGD